MTWCIIHFTGINVEWAFNQPNYASRNQFCATLSTDTWKINDEFCYNQNTFPVLCEKRKPPFIFSVNITRYKIGK